MSQSTVAAAAHDTSVPAPGHFRAVASPDKKSITTSWDAVPGATYTLKERNKSPNGVPGATDITGTSSVRHPGGHGVYEYYVVAIRDGVESADSEHVTVDLADGHTPPSTSTTPPATGGSPEDILQIGEDKAGGPWKLDIGPRKQDAQSVEGAYGDDDRYGKVDGYGRVTVKEAGMLAKFTHARYFTPTLGGTSVTFTSYMDGAVKQNTGSEGSNYPRTELSELKDGVDAAWTAGDGVHTLSGRTAVLALPRYKRKVCVAQIHGTASDTLELRVEGEDPEDGEAPATDGFTWVVHWSNGNDSTDDHPYTPPPVKTGYRLGDEVAWKISADGGSVTVTIDGVEKFREKIQDLKGHPAKLEGQFFKTGCYTQTNEHPYDHGDHQDSRRNKPEDAVSLTLRDLRLSHGPSDGG